MKPKASLLHFLAIAGSSVLAVSSAHAVDGNWNTVNSGNWSLSSNWVGSPSPVPGGAGSTISIASDITGARNVTIDTTSRTVGHLTMGDASHGFTVNASGGASLIFDNGLSDATLTENFTTGTADFISAPITLNSNLALTTNGSLTLSGVISGLTSITKSGAGTLILSGNNTFSGGFNYNGGTLGAFTAGTFTGFGTGTLTIGSGSGGFSVPSGTPTITIGNNINWNQGTTTFTRPSSGVPTFVYDGNITLGQSTTLNSGAATYQISHTFNGNIGDGGLGYGLSFNTANANGSAVTFNGTNTFTGNLSVSGSARMLTIGSSGSLNSGNYAGNITARGGLTYSSSTNQTLSGAIIDTTLTKNTSTTSTLTLSGTNSYTGVTTVSAGTLKFARTTSLYNNTVGSWTAANIRVASGATLAFNVGGTGEFTTGNVTTLLTNLADSSSATNGMNAGSRFGFDTTNASGTFTIADVIADSTGASGGARGLTKLGTGTLEVTNTNTYTGSTSVNAGRLLVNGSISTSVLTTVASGATIGGSGSIGALTIQSGGFINPGNSPGILNTGDYTQMGLYTAEIEGLVAGNSAGNHDQIIVTGTVDITGGSLATLFSTFTPVNGDLIFILLNDGTDAITGTFTGLAQGATVTTYGGYDWIISYNADSVANTFTGTPDGNDIALMAFVIPEPSSALLGGLGALLLLRRRR